MYKKQSGYSEHTVVEYKRFIKETLCCIADKKIKDLRLTDQAVIMDLGRQHGYWGDQRSCSVFLQFCKYLDDRGEKLPFKIEKIKLPQKREKEQYFLTPEEFEDFVSKLSNSFYGLRDRCLYELLWSTGLRIGEALAVDLKDIDFKERTIKVHTFKGGEGEKVYISDRLEYWLKAWEERRQDDNPALFITYHGDVVRLKRCQARKNLAKYRKDFGIEKNLAHPAFRKGFCTHLLNSGANIKEVQYLARHRSERTTLKFYCMVKKGQVKEVHQNIFNNVFTRVREVLTGVNSVI